jgi:hypothetical protein
MKGGCRICSAVWKLKTRTPKDVWGILLFWKPITTFKVTDCFMDVRLEENQTYQCHFDLLETECRSPLAKYLSLLILL